MKHDQCPSTSGKTTSSAARGSCELWRSPEDLADSPEFREFLEKEFPGGASEISDSTRREFIKLMGAGLAIAGAATVPGCRRPDHKIMPYSQVVPEDIVPGNPLYYATSMPLPGGGAEGLLVRTESARPIKIEGNPLHPINRGKSSVWSQASILGLYDPDRLKYPEFKNPVRGYIEATWDDFGTWADEHFAQYGENGGRGLAFIVDKKTSPSRDAVRDRMLSAMPAAQWVPYEAVDNAEAFEGSRLAFGTRMRELPKLENAKVVVSFDRDFMGREANALPNARGFASSRRVMKAHDPMSRLYVAETGTSDTGSMADHRMRLSPSRVSAFAVALAQAVAERAPGRFDSSMTRALRNASVPGRDEFFVEKTEKDGSVVKVDVIAAIADDLVDAHNLGSSLILAGPSQPAAVHALVHALNAALGNAGNTVAYVPMGDDEGLDSHALLMNLAQQMASGAIETLVCINVNPVYDAPVDLNFAELFAKVANTITLSVGNNETAAASVWRLNGADYLESWGDTESADGTIAPIQPMIAPLYGYAKTDIELLAMISGAETTDGFEIVRDVWRARTNTEGPAFEKLWKRALHDGVLAGSTPTASAAGIDSGAVANAVSGLRLADPPSEISLEAVFVTTHLHDGRFANYPWLQELPDPGTRVVWDNPVLVSPATATALRVEPSGGNEDPYTGKQIPTSRMADVTIDGRTMRLPVWILPGMADNCVIVPVGYGRTVAGHVGNDVGFNTYGLRGSSALRTAAGVTVARSREKYEIVSTQNHWSMEDRTSIVRQLDHKYWEEMGDLPPEKIADEIYAALPGKNLNLAERLGELAHMPEPYSIYDNPQNMSAGDVDPSAEVHSDVLGKDLPPEFARGSQWGMTIDLTTCSGCGACTTACQAENNIPVVGKREVAKGREMGWIRVDRYFTGDLNNPDQILHQPIACVHCENAPCETVCPVNATTHGRSGTNDMVYNRCIGTRYCANNCPYKVRRFNFFDYSQTKFNGTFVGEDELGIRPRNVNFVPPRLRQKLDEIQKMRMNPDVTVRGRGVMEKCTYCIQRINRAEDELRVQDTFKDLPRIPDGLFQTACQQSCPTDSIVFGDILDKASRISETRNNNRSYMLLGFLNTRPRTTHMVRVSNPNPAIREAVNPFHGHNTHDSHDSEPQDGGHAVFFKKSREGEPVSLALRVIGAPA